jgi:hypothetical protein
MITAFALLCTYGGVAFINWRNDRPVSFVAVLEDVLGLVEETLTAVLDGAFTGTVFGVEPRRVRVGVFVAVVDLGFTGDFTADDEKIAFSDGKAMIRTP